MMPCTAQEVCAAVRGTLVQGAGTFTGVTTDSRKVGKGDLFIPLVGERLSDQTSRALPSTAVRAAKKLEARTAS